VKWLEAAPEVLACEFVLAGAATLHWRRIVGARVALALAVGSLFAAAAATQMAALAAAGLAACGLMGATATLAFRLLRHRRGK
jgi:hypothetical protein